MSTYELRPITWVLAQEGRPMFDETATEVRIIDLAGGEFVEVSQEGRDELGRIHIDRSEWPALRDAIEQAINRCRG